MSVRTTPQVPDDPTWTGPMRPEWASVRGHMSVHRLLGALRPLDRRQHLFIADETLAADHGDLPDRVSRGAASGSEPSDAEGRGTA